LSLKRLITNRPHLNGKGLELRRQHPAKAHPLTLQDVEIQVAAGDELVESVRGLGTIAARTSVKRVA